MTGAAGGVLETPRDPTVELTIEAGEQGASSDGTEIRRKLGLLMALRVLTVTVLFGATVAVNLAGRGSALFGPAQLLIYGTVVSTYLLTIVFAVLLRYSSNFALQSFLQVGGDVLICTSLVYITGGTESIFVFLYTLSIVNAAVLLYRTGALAAAVASWSCFGAIVAAQANGWIPKMTPQLVAEPPPQLGDLVYILCMSFAGFHLVALLAGQLAQQLRDAGVALAKERQTLETMRSLHATMMTTLNDALIVVDLEGNVVFVNQAAEELFSKSKDRLLLQPLNKLLPSAATLVARAEDLQEAQRVELPLTRRDGHEMHLGLSASPYVNHAGSEEGTIVLIQDLTRLRVMEQAVQTAERLAAIGEVAAGLAHEIRNPLASLSGSIELLRARMTSAEDDNGRRLMDIVLRETDRLNHLITDFLGFARPSRPHAEEVTVDRLVEDTLTVFRNDLALSKGHRLEAVLGCTDVRARLDLGQIKQVLWNLLVNAMQASPNGGLITVRTFRDPRGRISIEVQDQGEGIAPEDRPKIFDPFFTTKAEGTGLGLAAVFRIVAGHEGTIDVESSPGEGTVFRVTLPGD